MRDSLSWYVYVYTPDFLVCTMAPPSSSSVTFSIVTSYKEWGLGDSVREREVEGGREREAEEGREGEGGGGR